MRCWEQDFNFNMPNAYKIRGGRTGVLDPSQNRTFDLIRGILTDYDKVFPDNMLMLGGDEVIFRCYRESENITQYMNDNNISTYEDLFQLHINKVKKIVNEINPNKRTLYWSNEDTLYLKFKPEDILMYWG